MPPVPERWKGYTYSLRLAAPYIPLASLILFFSALGFSALGNTQASSQTEKPAPTMGVSTGAAHPAVKDSKSRPITAGGFVDDAPVVFIDITKPAGLDKFHHRSGTPEKRSIIETPGSGVALLDYDNDGWPDIYLLNGSTLAAFKGEEAPLEPCSFTMIMMAALVR